MGDVRPCKKDLGNGKIFQDLSGLDVGFRAVFNVMRERDQHVPDAKPSRLKVVPSQARSHKRGTDILQHDPSRGLNVSTATQGHLQHLCDNCAK